jgi:hypothetical protein
MNHQNASSFGMRRQRNWGIYRISIEDDVFDANGNFIFHQLGFYDRFRGKAPKTVDKAVEQELILIQ